MPASKIKQTTLDDFYREASIFTGKDISTLLPPGINKEIGHFNLFDIADTIKEVKARNVMPYNRRAYYKISLIRGRSTAEYADKVIDIENNALLFASPKVPYHWIPKDNTLSGYFCIFTEAFMHRSKTGLELDELPIFKAGGYPIFQISAKETKELTALFKKMQNEINSDYAFKYDLLRNYVVELIHYGQKLQPLEASFVHSNAGARVTSLFIELLERQFPIESTHQRFKLRTAKDFSERLNVHVNHLNKVLKDTMGKTTTDIIAARVIQEAKILLKQTDWNISEIAYSLGFEETAHFSNFFRRQSGASPVGFRS